MAKKKGKKTKRRVFFLGLGSLLIIIVTTFSIGRYWVEIFAKYQEKQQLEKKLTRKRRSFKSGC